MVWSSVAPTDLFVPVTQRGSDEMLKMERRRYSLQRNTTEVNRREKVVFSLQLCSGDQIQILLFYILKQKF